MPFGQLPEHALKPFYHLLCALAALPGLAYAHAVPERTVPPQNAILRAAPPDVAVYFDTELEPLFSKLSVAAASGEKISQGDGRVDSNNHKLLRTRLTPVTRGEYHVRWNVVARDGHRAQGEYTFSVK